MNIVLNIYTYRNYKFIIIFLILYLLNKKHEIIYIDDIQTMYNIYEIQLKNIIIDIIRYMLWERFIKKQTRRKLFLKLKINFIVPYYCF